MNCMHAKNLKRLQYEQICKTLNNTMNISNSKIVNRMCSINAMVKTIARVAQPFVIALR